MQQTQTQITQTLKQLRQLTEIDLQKNWTFFTTDYPISQENNIILCPDLDPQNGKLATKNENGYLVWDAGNQVRWFVQKITIPHSLNQYPLTGLTLRLCLTWWSADTQIFVNQQFVQAGDLFDSSARILLTDNAQTGDEFIVAIRCMSTGHDIGGLMRSKLVYENLQTPDPGWVADELEVLYKYYQQFAPEKLEYITQHLHLIHWKQVHNATVFNQSLSQLRNAILPQTRDLKKRNFHVMGHAHLDMAWLWEESETYQVAQRTFESVLNLKQDFPELTFCHTSPVLYEWVEQNRPELFKRIQNAVKQGYWDTLGGMWVEPEVNLPSGESLARQLLYGQRYTQEKFGQMTRVAWLTDSFGFSGQLPQILQQGGIEYFVTQKLHWNDSTEFPYGVFWWESPDGTKILTLMSPPNITGVMDMNPQTMTDYSVKWEAQTGLQDIFWLPGVGDHGGGPTRDMLEVNRRWQDSPFFPETQFTTAAQYLDHIKQLETQSPFLPTWKDELYLELHRGCYTTHADQKWFNRRCEGVLYEAELVSSLGCILGKLDYPKKEIETIWKKVLFNQFHDILPGTSIPEVFVKANQDWESALQEGERMVEVGLSAIASSISLPSPPGAEAVPFLVFNSLNWVRSQLVSLPTDSGLVYDCEGNLLPTQLTPEKTLLFLAENIPPVGYRLYWRQKNSPASSQKQREEENRCFTEKPTLEKVLLHNKYLKISLNPQNGNISSIYDQSSQQEVLNGEGNVLQAFEDKGQYWDAWNIDPNYEQKKLAPAVLNSIEWLEWGELRSRIRVIRQINQSTFTQDYILESHSPQLKIVTTVDWKETQVLVKAAFPLNLHASITTAEIACGTIERPTNPQTPAEKAKWEIFAHRWADLGNNDYGVSLLNDCKYGYDSKPNQLRLTLLKSPLWPDPTSDRGQHHFTYTLYPHGNSWQVAETVNKGYELNIPLRVLEIKTSQPKTVLPPTHSFLDFGAKNFILTAFKQSEDHPHQYILRGYESQGEATQLTFNTSLPLQLTHTTNFLEKDQQLAEHEDLLINPWQIKSFVVNKYR